MGNPVVHFEVMGTDGEKLQSVLLHVVRVGDRRGQLDELRGAGEPGRQTTADGTGNLAVASVPPRPLHGWLRDLLRRGARRRGHAGPGGGEPRRPAAVRSRQVMEGLIVGQFADPEGHVIGVMTSTD